MSWGIELEPVDGDPIEVFEGHTYNLTPMWRLAGVFEVSRDLDGEVASTAGIRAATGLLRAVTSPDQFRELNPANGWGDFEGFVAMLTRFAIACADNPTAIMRWNG